MSERPSTPLPPNRAYQLGRALSGVGRELREHASIYTLAAAILVAAFVYAAVHRYEPVDTYQTDLYVERDRWTGRVCHYFAPTGKQLRCYDKR